MPTRAWFPTRIYEARLPARGGAAFRRSLLDDVAKIRAHDEAGRRWCKKNYPAGYTSYGSMAQLHRGFSTFADLAREIDRHVRRFAADLQLDLRERRLEMIDCWVNVMPRFAMHGLHLHPLATISGTYYLRTPRGCSRIRFEDPRLERMMAAPPRLPDARPENRQQVLYDVEPGKLLLWESWLRHEVQSNPVDAERVSVSFNYGWF
jgi:uncharacterized protein (TIGR02466 family)